jgi:hypothetical protein
MKWDSPFWNATMELYRLILSSQYLNKPLKGIIRGEFQKEYDKAIKNLYVGESALNDLFRFLLTEKGIIRGTLESELTPEEKEARNGDILGITTEEARKALEEAKKRLEEKARLAPVLEADKKLVEAKRLVESRRMVVEKAQKEREIPVEAFKEAEALVKQAEDELKKSKAQAGIK